jgi:polysaccharide export outer membrane protein
MNTTFLKKISVLLLLTCLFFSCAPNKEILYLQGTAPHTATATSYEPILQPADELMIVISAENPELAVPYNLNSVFLQSNSSLMTGQERIQTYLINKEGTIEMPMLGTIKLEGLTRMQAIDKIKSLLVNHIKDPIVNIRLLNFKVSVLGEVQRPGTMVVQNDRVTLLEALSFAGDLTIYGKRNSIMIIREVDGVKTINSVDLTSSDLIHSPYYFLAQNDVVYVEPNKTRVNSSVIGPNVTVILTATSLLIAILAITIN